VWWDGVSTDEDQPVVDTVRKLLLLDKQKKAPKPQKESKRHRHRGVMGLSEV